MIHVSQGHELGIGLEVFLKSFLHLSQNQQKKFFLHAHAQTIKTHLELSNLPYEFSKNEIKIGKSVLKWKEPKYISEYQSTNSLVSAMEACKKQDQLFTLPTSKDQLIYKKKKLSGHTEFFRSYYKKKEISMFFFSPEIKVFLVTDHVALKDVGEKISSALIEKKISLVLNYSKKFKLCDFEEILISGINPHCGENGLLGKEDSKVTKAIKNLTKEYPKKHFVGPISGDILALTRKQNIEQLLVYMFHDQGLSFFKSQMGLLGINISLGLPYLRTSVDHGTAFDLYGKNQANFSGCLYVMKEMLKLK